MKKGFTLIELLAVILILGIIALIAIPTVNNILKESRMGAFRSTVTNIEKAVEEKCTTEQIKNQEITTMYTITNGVISPSLDIKGELPNGFIYVNNECIVALTLSDNNFTGTKDFGGELVITEGSNEPRIYVEGILNGADPVLGDNLVPVTINNDGTVVEADLYSKWYSYAEKKWANAVILKADGKIEEDGTILEDSIESYFVWIPRYKYKLFNTELYSAYIEGNVPESKAKPIDIVFESKNAEPSVGTNVGDYHSHPAFTSFDTNGLWVAKFETSGTLSNIEIKPNKQAIRNNILNDYFNAGYNYKRTNESHMMKNIEWGAVAYLSLSKYGAGSNININNNSNYMTGYSKIEGKGTGTTSDVTQPYNTEVGYKASTTGNITGIYDMAGGSNEYMASTVMGYLGSSGLTSIPKNQYIDFYDKDYTEGTYIFRILGDATGELGPFYYNGTNVLNSWYNDISIPNNTNYPWYIRGGTYSNGSLLYFDCLHGYKIDSIGFRVVLAN